MKVNDLVKIIESAVKHSLLRRVIIRARIKSLGMQYNVYAQYKL